MIGGGGVGVGMRGGTKNLDVKTVSLDDSQRSRAVRQWRSGTVYGKGDLWGKVEK